MHTAQVGIWLIEEILCELKADRNRKEINEKGKIKNATERAY
jgi:hypothetical protein